MEFKTKSIVFDKFEILEQIGTGGMGTIFKVLNIPLDKVMVLKVLQTGSSEKAILRFQKEAKILSQLKHPNIATVFDFGLSSDNVPYLAIEFVEGVSLEELLKSGPMPQATVLQILNQVCDALSHAHKLGVVHRDVKPGNIMIRQDGTLPMRAVLLDFGIAKIVAGDGAEHQRLTHTGAVIGSPLYMSPEQCSGKPTSAKTDQYSLGCVVYAMLTGEPPFAGESALETMLMHQNTPLPPLGAKVPSLLPALEAVITRLLSKQEDDRFESMEALIQTLAPIEVEPPDDQSRLAPPLERLFQRVSLKKTNPKLLWALTVVVVLAGAVLATRQLSYFKKLRQPHEQLEKTGVWEPDAEDGVPLFIKKARKAHFTRFGSKFVNDESMRYFDGYTELQELNLSDTEVSDRSLAYLKNSKILTLELRNSCIGTVSNVVIFPYVYYLDLRQSKIGNAQLKQLEKLKMLSVLRISETDITEAGLKYLTNIPSLTEVELNNGYSRKRIEELAKQMPNCTFRPFFKESLLGKKFKSVRSKSPELRIANAKECMRIAIKAQGKDSAATEFCLRELAQAQNSNGQWNAANKSLEEAVSIAKRLHNDNTLTADLEEQSLFCWMEGARQASNKLKRQALDTRLRALKLMETTAVKTSFKLVRELNIACHWAMVLEDYPEVVRRGKTALGLIDKYHVDQKFSPKQKPNLASVNEYVGTALLNLRKLDEALPYFQNALNARKKMGVTDGLEYAVNLINMSRCSTEVGTKKKILLQAYKKLHPERSPADPLTQNYFCDICYFLATAYAEEENFPFAIKYIKQAQQNALSRVGKTETTQAGVPASERAKFYGGVLDSYLRMSIKKG